MPRTDESSDDGGHTPEVHPTVETIVTWYWRVMKTLPVVILLIVFVVYPVTQLLGCSTDVLRDTDVPADRVTVRTWDHLRLSHDRLERFGSLNDPPVITFDQRNRSVVIRTLVHGISSSSMRNPDARKRESFAWVERIGYDEQTGDLSVVFNWERCQSSGDPTTDLTAMQVTVSFPDGLPDHVRAEKPTYTHERTVISTATRNSSRRVTPIPRRA